MKVRYSGKDSFKCQMCDKYAREHYIAEPELPKLVDWKSLSLCSKCAKRENGSKNIKRWKRLHDLGRNV
jgi:hypothetical protein